MSLVVHFFLEHSVYTEIQLGNYTVNGPRSVRLFQSPHPELYLGFPLRRFVKQLIISVGRMVGSVNCQRKRTS